MDRNAELLNYIYQNASMGMESTETVMKSVDDAQTSEHLKKQKEDYSSIRQEADRLLRERGQQEKEVSAMKKIMSYLSINAQTLSDNSPAHIAELMVQGSAMGIVDITKNLKKYEGADPAATKLGQTLYKLEEDSFDQWKKYLQIVS